MIQKTQALLFDVDGVLVDSEPCHVKSWQIPLRKYGVDLADSYFVQWVGRSDQDFCHEATQKFQLPVTPQQLLCEKEETFHTLIETDMKTLPGLKHFLDQAQAMFPMGVVSSSSRKSVLAILSAKQLESYFRVVVGYEDVAQAKPSSEPYLKALVELNVDPGQCLAFEDSPSGAQSAKAAGLQVVGVLSSFGERELSPLSDMMIQDFRAPQLNSLFGLRP